MILLKDKNNDKLKILDLDRFKTNNYFLFSFESLDDKSNYVIGYWEILNFFNDKFFFKPNIKIVHLNL